MGDTAIRLTALIAARRERLTHIESATHRWSAVSAGLTELQSSLKRLAAHPDLSDEVRVQLSAPSLPPAQAAVAELHELLRAAASRFARDTVNIGVSGRARVGKSTLLQSISGLSDTQIPTGSGLPVTAVRSRIFHSSGPERAVLRFHDSESFLSEVVHPYHAQIGLPAAPMSLEEFRCWRYPEPEGSADSEPVALLVRLRQMQQALWSYETDLTGGERVLDLDELRPYVAYPTDEQVESGDACPRPYLAVRDARIDCSFPHADVASLGIVDLPGLGENDVQSETHHVVGLRHEVDLVVMVKRPVEGMGYWGKEDAKALSLLDEVRGFIQQRGNFVELLLNVGTSEDHTRAPALRNHIKREVNGGQDGRWYTVRETNAKDAEAVGTQLLGPLLDRLARTLPVMDDDILNGTRRAEKVAALRVVAVLAEVRQALTGARSRSAAPAEDLEVRVQELRRSLAVDLSVLLEELRTYAYAKDPDPDYETAVEAAHRQLRCWLAAGLGTGPQDDDPDTARSTWCEEALRVMRVALSSGGLVADELHRIRVGTGRHFSRVDTYFDRRVAWLWTEVTTLLAGHTGTLLTERPGQQGLRALAGFARAAAEPCPTLEEAVEGLLELRLDYRSQLHPRVHRELERLRPQQRDPLTGMPQPQIVVEISPAGAGELYEYLSERAEQTAHRTRQALLRESMTPATVLLSALEHFDDLLIRSADAERDLRRFARSYRNELWPGVYEGLDSGHARFAAVESACRTVQETLEGAAV
ncbi:hypothetical protein ACFV6E_22255 [Streptomyces sp. NPDC059785]|uniref:hypothetical protein n=1 Tax=Streptomyces sp. NPDC059785 TaxID=3346945 RepID=UPI0036460FE2